MAIHRIGLTGGIGSGKSTVAAVWVELGAVLVDTEPMPSRTASRRPAAWRCRR